MFTEKANSIFRRAIADYHLHDNVETPISNPYTDGTIEATLYHKCWIDTVQWHFEDIIRDPNIDPAEALVLKRRIDKSNQDRTDMVEDIDTYFRTLYKDITVQPGATINTESPAWAIDRLSILAPQAVAHERADGTHRRHTRPHSPHYRGKLAVLLEQQQDLSTAIDQLLDDIAAGRKYMKVYRQMKMYNDPSTNPVLYKK